MATNDNATPHTSGRLIPDWLAARAAVSADRLALTCRGERWTFAQLDTFVAACASRLTARGVRSGDRVALLLANGAPYVVLVHALARVGAVAVPINLRLTQAEIAWQLADAGAAFLVVGGPHPQPLSTAVERGERARPRWRGVGGEAAAEIVRADELLAGEAGADVPVVAAGRFDLDTVQTIVYTSGTTGRPKGAMLTYGNHWWSAIGSSLNLGIRDDDRWLACLPLFHVGGLSILFRSVIYGIAAVVHERFDAAAVNRAIEDDGVTIVSVVAAMLQRMLDERGGRRYPPRLRAVLLGGGPAPRPLLEACAELGVPVVQTYGLTETASQVATLAPEDALRRLGSAGKPLLPMELRIEREGHPVPAGEVGEIAVRGPSVTAGYWARPDATALAIRGGWFHTGDLGRVDADGYLYVLDRRDDLIISGGENVYPAEVEAALLAHPAVEEAGVTGAPDAEWGQVVVATVKLRPGGVATADELIAFCGQRLARYKLPRAIRFADALPRNAAGKLLRRELRTMDCFEGMT